MTPGSPLRGDAAAQPCSSDAEETFGRIAGEFLDQHIEQLELVSLLGNFGERTVVSLA